MAAAEECQPEAKRPRLERQAPSQAATDLEIDGSFLEGGGQLLRSAFAFSALCGRSIRVSKIRAGRPRKGIAAQHLSAVRLLSDVCTGALGDDTVGSHEVSFTPGALAAGDFASDPQTAGSATLAAQAALLPMLFSGGPCSCELRGGTDVPFSPPLDFFQQVYLTMLSRMGAACAAGCTSRGFFPRGGGALRLSVQPLREPLCAVDLSSRGQVAVVRVVLHTTSPIGRKEQAAVEAARGALTRLLPTALGLFQQRQQLQVKHQLEKGPEGKFKYWVDAVVEMTTGALFHAGSEPQDLPFAGQLGQQNGFRSMPELFSTAAHTVCDSLAQQLASGAAVGPLLCDQLILPASLARGTTRLLTTELSLHARTQIHIATLFLPELEVREDIMGERGQLTMLEIVGAGRAPPPATALAEEEMELPEAVPEPRLQMVPPAGLSAAPKAKTSAQIPKAHPKMAAALAQPGASVMMLAALPKAKAPPMPMPMEEEEVAPALVAQQPLADAAPTIPAPAPGSPAPATEVPPAAQQQPGPAPTAAAPQTAAPPAAATTAAAPPAAQQQPGPAPKAAAQQTAAAPAAATTAAAPPRPQAAEAPAATANQYGSEVLKLGGSVLSTASQQLLDDFKNDMKELAKELKIEVEVDRVGGRLILKGGAEDRKAAMGDLKEILAFYFSPK